MQHIDLSYQRALPLLPFQTERITIMLVGLGGTGSFLARHVACLVSLLAAAGKKVTLTFIDPDRVESVNIPRQNFCAAEVGRYKAETLASRYAQAFGVEISCIPACFSPEMVRGEWNSLTILVGCVDNAAARVTMEQALTTNEPRAASQGNRIRTSGGLIWAMAWTLGRCYSAQPRAWMPWLPPSPSLACPVVACCPPRYSRNPGCVSRDRRSRKARRFRVPSCLSPPLRR